MSRAVVISRRSNPSRRSSGREFGRRRSSRCGSALASQRYIAGDRFSIADITALVGVDFGRVINLGPTPEQKNVLRWHAEVSSRTSARA